MSVVPQIPLKKSGPPPGFCRWIESMYGPGPKPRDFEYVETWSAFTEQTDVINPSDMHPAQNVACLYWRPAKSFGEEAN